eukprot:scaffold141555_cov27-Tisochrysis_lutea.AAC.2
MRGCARAGLVYFLDVRARECRGIQASAHPYLEHHVCKSKTVAWPQHECQMQAKKGRAPAQQELPERMARGTRYDSCAVDLDRHKLRGSRAFGEREQTALILHADGTQRVSEPSRTFDSSGRRLLNVSKRNDSAAKQAVEVARKQLLRCA